MIRWISLSISSLVFCASIGLLILDKVSITDIFEKTLKIGQTSKLESWIVWEKLSNNTYDGNIKELFESLDNFDKTGILLIVTERIDLESRFIRGSISEEAYQTQKEFLRIKEDSWIKAFFAKLPAERTKGEKDTALPRQNLIAEGAIQDKGVPIPVAFPVTRVKPETSSQPTPYPSQNSAISWVAIAGLIVTVFTFIANAVFTWRKDRREVKDLQLKLQQLEPKAVLLDNTC